VQLRNDVSSFDALYNAVSSFYYDRLRSNLIFESGPPTNDADSGYFVRFLVDRKHVAEYRIASDRGISLSIVSLAIGPHYFSPGDFWDYDNSQRFSLEASTEAVSYNLTLLDEFLQHRGASGK
jgi:hypothetical protein